MVEPETQFNLYFLICKLKFCQDKYQSFYLEPVFVFCIVNDRIIKSFQQECVYFPFISYQNEFISNICLLGH